MMLFIRACFPPTVASLFARELFRYHKLALASFSELTRVVEKSRAHMRRAEALCSSQEFSHF